MADVLDRYNAHATRPSDRVHALGTCATPPSPQEISPKGQLRPAEGPFGSVIAHGFLTLALIAGLHNECYAIGAARRWVNYGLDRVRFLRPLTPGTDICLEVTLEDLAITPGGGRLRLGCILVTRGGAPVVVASGLVLAVEQEAA